jgi:hypothetical protein
LGKIQHSYIVEGYGHCSGSVVMVAYEGVSPLDTLWLCLGIAM